MTLELSSDSSYDVSPTITSKSNINRDFSFISKYTHHQLFRKSKVKDTIDHALIINKFTGSTI